MTTLLLSVVVPTHGRVDLFRETLDSLKKQTHQEFEVIVTDDSPNESDRLAIKKYTEDCVNLNTKYLYAAGFSQANNTNRGLDATTTEYVRILHSDDLLAPDCLAKEMTLLSNNPDVDCLYHEVLPFSQKLPAFVTEARTLPGHLVLPESWLHKEIFTKTVIPSAMVFRRSLLEKTGLMNTDYRFLCDWELFYKICMEIYANKRKLMYLPAGYVGWRVHPDSTTTKLFIAHYFEHKDFIHKIAVTYRHDNILSVKELKDNIKKAAKYRLKRLLRDYKSASPQVKLRNFPKLLSVYFSNLYTFTYLSRLFILWSFKHRKPTSTPVK